MLRRPDSARRRRILIVLGATLAALLLCEMTARVAPTTFGLPADWGRTAAGSAHFEPRPHLLYTHKLAGEWVNERGFTAPSWPGAPEPGVLRIVCLGASTTEVGNDGGHAASYPAFLETGLNEFLTHGPSGQRVEVINIGMAGWTTAETLVHWFLAAKDLEPDLVLIHHAANDVAPRMWPGFRSDYAHYRQTWQDARSSGFLANVLAHSALIATMRGPQPALTLDDFVVRAKPAGDSEMAPQGPAVFRRNVASIARDAERGGARVGLVTLPIAPRGQDLAADLESWRDGIADNNAALRELAREEGYLLVDLAQQAEAGHELLNGAFIDLVHVTPDGNLWKALAIGARLAAQWQPIAGTADDR